MRTVANVLTSLPTMKKKHVSDFISNYKETLLQNIGNGHYVKTYNTRYNTNHYIPTFKPHRECITVDQILGNRKHWASIFKKAILQPSQTNMELCKIILIMLDAVSKHC